MTRSLLACLMLIVLAAPPGAAAESRAGAAPAASRSKEGPAAKPKPRRAPAPARSGSAPRRLEDIHIEGEIPVPQVLFVTARDQRRLTPFHHQRYLKTSLELAEQTPLPSRVEIVRPTPAADTARTRDAGRGASAPRPR